MAIGFARLSGYVEKGRFKQSFLCVEMMGLIGMGSGPMVGATVAVAVEISMALNK